MNRRYLFSLVVPAILIFAGMFLTQCDSGQKTTPSKVACIVDDDCPKNQACVNKVCVPKVDGDEAEQNTSCITDADCAGGAEEMICMDSVCVPKFKSCTSNADCYPCQTCDMVTGRCVGEPCKPDGDEAENDTTDNNGDTEDANDNVTTDGDEEPEPTTCRKDSDCPENMICSPEMKCVTDCTQRGCQSDEGRCNPNTGHCEWCDPQCEAGESCNFNPTAWYCGSPCEPPCPDGYACQDSECVELRCPGSCPPGYECSGNTGYICRPQEVEPEHRMVPTPVQGATCLPPTTPCIEGVSECCSGACIMGHCM